MQDATRYKPSGIPLTEHEREVLVILMEECAEVALAASKLVRFGRETYPGYGENTAVLSTEFGELMCLVEMAQKLALMRGPEIHNGKLGKYERLKFFMQTDAPAA